MTERSMMPTTILQAAGADGAAYLQDIEMKQRAQANLDDLDGGATLPDVITKINAILAAARGG